MLHDTFGAPKEVVLQRGTLRYHDVGTGPVLVFIHGILANSALWRQVVPLVADRFRCIAPDLPLGAHSIAMPSDADMSPHGVARMVAELLDTLDLRDVTLVGNDTGGAICQLVITAHPARIARLVLTNSDAFEAFFPLIFRWFTPAARMFGTGFMNTLARILRSRRAQRLLMATVSRSRFSDAVLDRYLASFLRDAGVRRDLMRFLQRVSNKDTLAAAQQFGQFRHPVHLLWGRDDKIFPPSLGRRLQQAFPNATLELVGPSRAFVPEDQPAALAQLIRSFAHDQALKPAVPYASPRQLANEQQAV
ncbi:MAG: alpha/beta hydrolase [Chloroflexales bacterium]|nr:alpha/beta hydrolase [Chloroflexales bacterium]